MMIIKKNKILLFFLIPWAFWVVIQCLWFFELNILFETFLLLVCGFSGIIYISRRNILAEYPISSSMILGYVTYYFLLPPIATFIEGKPITYNLIHPTLVFLHAFLCLVFLLLAHSIYRYSNFLQKFRRLLSNKIYQPLGFFQAPSNFQLIIIGGIGIISMAYQVFIVGVYQAQTNNILDKFIQGFYPLAYFPYIMLVVEVIGGRKHVDRKWIGILFLYSIILLVISLGRNSRASLFMGFASVILIYFYGVIVGIYKVKRRALSEWTILILIFVFLIKPINDIAISMVAVRSSRINISGIELVEETLKAYQNKELINSYQLYTNAVRSDWDWLYVDNLFFARLCNLKFADQSIDSALKMTPITKEYIRGIELQRILANFPRPIISFLGLPIEKDFVGSASSGDFMYYAISGKSYVLGGYRTGSLFGNGYAMFDWWYLPIFSFILLILFPLADALTLIKKINGIAQARNFKTPRISPIVVVVFFTWFFYLTSAATGVESVSDLISYLLRGWVQTLFIYSLAYWLSGFSLRLLINRNS